MPDQDREDDNMILPPVPDHGSFKIYQGNNANSPMAIPVRYELRWSHPVLEWSDSLFIRLYTARPCVAGIRILYRDTVEVEWMAAMPDRIHEHAFYLAALPHSRVYRIQFLAAWGEVMEELHFRRDQPTEGEAVD